MSQCRDRSSLIFPNLYPSSDDPYLGSTKRASRTKIIFRTEKKRTRVVRKPEPTKRRTRGALRRMSDGMEMDQLRQKLEAGQAQEQQQEPQEAQGQGQEQARQKNMPPKPVFIYGTLCAKPLLAWVLTGDANRVDEITPLITPAEAQNIARYALRGKDYPAAVLKEGATTKGILLEPATRSQRRKLDDFEGEIYRVENVALRRLDELGGVVEGGEEVQADVYLWDGDEDSFDREWDFEEFERERLEDWLGLFKGMEMVGDDDDDQ